MADEADSPATRRSRTKPLPGLTGTDDMGDRGSMLVGKQESNASLTSDTSTPMSRRNSVRKDSSFFKTTPAQPLDHACLLSPWEHLAAMTSGHLDQGWLLQDATPSTRSVSQSSRSVRDRYLVPGAVCLVLVLVNANDTLLKAASQQRGKAAAGERYLPSSVMLASNAISVLVGNFLCLFHERPLPGAPCRWRLRGLGQFWSGRQLLQMSVPAVCFTLSGTLKFVALGLVSPDVVIILEQGSMLLCALMGRCMLGKRYSVRQVLMLLQVTCGVLWYQRAVRGEIGRSAEEDASQSLAHHWTGLALMCASVVMVTAGGLSCEKLLKGSTKRPFYVQKAQMELSMAAAGLVYCLVVQPVLEGACPLLELGPLHGWDVWTVSVLALHTCKSWLATTVVRMLDNLTFTLAGNVALFLVYVERLAFLSEDGWESFKLEVFGALCCTALGVGGFALASTVQHWQSRTLQRSKRKKLSLQLRMELQKPLLERERPQIAGESPW